MARVTSQKTRQAILTTDSPWNANLIPEKLALFDLNGVPISLTGAGIPVGGTIGQVLGKTGNEDFNTNWVDPAQGGGEGGGFLVPWDEDTTYEFGDQVVYEGNIYEANSETTGYIPGTDPPPGGPAPYLDLYPAKALTTEYQDAQVTAAEPVIPGSQRGGPVDLFAFIPGSPGLYQFFSIPRAGYDAYVSWHTAAGVKLGWNDDSAGSAHPAFSIGVPAEFPIGDTCYVMFHSYSGAGSPVYLSSVKMILTEGATLGAFPSGEAAPWDFVGVAEVSVPEGGTAGQVLGKVSDSDYDIAWINAGGGEIDPAYQGDWDVDTNYVETDIVRYDDTYWVATVDISAGGDPPAESVGVPELVGSNDTDTTGGGANANNTVQQQSFTVTEDITISAIGLKAVNGNMGVTRVLKILAANRSTVLATKTLPTEIPANEWGEIPLDTPLSLTTPTTYWIEISTGFVAVGPGSGGEPAGVVATVGQLYSDGAPYTSFSIAFRLYSSGLSPWSPTEAPSIGDGGESEPTQLSIYNAAEQVFTVTAPAGASPEDKLAFTLEEDGFVKVLAQLNAWANNDLVVYLYVDGVQAVSENGAALSRSCGAGSPIIQYLTINNGLSGFVQGSGAQTAPKVIAGDGIALYLPAGDHTVELRYHSSTGANARISHRRLTVILPAFNGGGGGGSGGGDGGSFLEAWQGPWTNQTYDAGDVVNHEGGLWIALDSSLDSDEPGATGATAMSVAPYAGYSANLLGTSLYNWTCGSGEANYEHLYFDVDTEGTLTIDKDSASTGYMRVRNNVGTSLYVGGNDASLTFSPGRYHIAIEGLSNVNESGTIRLVLGTAVLALGSPWELMVQGA